MANKCTGNINVPRNGKEGIVEMDAHKKFDYRSISVEQRSFRSVVSEQVLDC